MKIREKNFLKNTFIIACALCFAWSLIIFATANNSANAAESTYSVFIPNKSEEYHALVSPIHAYSDADITAVTNTNKQLIMFKPNGDFETVSSTTPLKQVMRFNSEYLLYSDNLTVTAIKLSDNSKTKLSYTDGNHEIKDLNNVFFDVALTQNGFVIATTNNQKLQLFYIDDTLNVSLLPYFLPNGDMPAGDISASDAPVAVNSESVFYVSGNQIHSKSINKLDSTEDYISVTPDYMIADDSNVYYINDHKIYRISISDKSVTLLNFADNDNYELGKVNSPTSLSIRNGNLLITDGQASGSAQEFKINGDTLEFTGYAIASGLTAYNRVASTATDIERYGKFVAALDGNKLTVIDTENCENYNRDGFINKFIGTAPDRFALGSGTVMYSVGNALKLTETETDNETEIETGVTTTALDICYQSGFYYVTYTDGTKTTVVKIDETTGEKVGENAEINVAATIATVDVFGNVYVADNAYVYKNEITDRYAFAGAKKLATDLAGNLFALSIDGKIYKLDENTGTFGTAFDVTGTLGEIKTFGLNFDRKEIFFLIDGKEEIYYTLAAGNVALTDVTPTEEFNAATESKAELKVYTANDSANVYSVSKDGEGFIFNGLIQKATEYPLIANITVGELTVRALASENGVVLINAKELTEKAAEIVAAPERAFLTTAVYAYAIPVIEKNGSFAMVNDSDKIKLEKGSTISVNKTFTLLKKTFYDATATINGETVDCYIPADFTATLLSEKFEFDSFTIEQVKKTMLYKDADFTEELFELDDGETVKVLENKNGALTVAAERDGGVIIGYVSENSLIVNPNTTVRNVLIILAVFGSLAGSISYFLLRKKN